MICEMCLDKETVTSIEIEGNNGRWDEKHVCNDCHIEETGYSFIEDCDIDDVDDLTEDEIKELRGEA